MNCFKQFTWRRCIVTLLAVPILLLAGGRSAHAAITCTGGGQAYTITLPASIAVPRDAPGNTVLATWSVSPTNNNLYTCVGNPSNANGVGYAVKPLSTMQATGQTWNGYPLYSTGVPGVGMAIGVNAVASNNGYVYTSSGPVTIAGVMLGGIFAPPSGWTGRAIGNGTGNASTPSYGGGSLQVALVTTGQVTTGGQIPAQQIAAGQAYWAASGGGSGTLAGSSEVTYGITATTISTVACTTPDVIVALGTHLASDMAAVGSATSAVNFNISVNNCPAGLGTGIGGLNTAQPAVQYRIDATTTVLNGAQGIVALDPSSSALGVGVQLLDGNGAAIPFTGSNTGYKTASGYNAATGGSFTIPLKARYYRTGAIKPGTANTSMTFTMQYQ